LPRIDEIISKYPFLRKIKEKTTKTTHDTKYDPREAISNYHSIHASSHLSEIMMLDNSKELLDMNLNEMKFFTLISIILYARNLEEQQREYKKGIRAAAKWARILTTKQFVFDEDTDLITE
jgi:hypothetical protein